jgi:hypothetical protein
MSWILRIERKNTIVESELERKTLIISTFLMESSIGVERDALVLRVS